jgi:deoxyribonuclease-4
MSVAGGLEKAFERGESIGCTVMQIFTKSNRQWQAKKITYEEAELFKATAKKSAIQFVMVHASYLINIGSPDLATAKKSVLALIEELERCAQLGIKYLVLHPGAHLQSGEAEALQRISDNLDEALAKSPSTTSILLENMAGQGSSLCNRFEQLAQLLKNSAYKKRLGVCFDTCHAFAAGYDFRDKISYEKMWHDFDSIVGLNQLHAIHINDSKRELGAHVDRHEHIGHGKLGKTAFELLMNDPRFFDIPKILETPKEDDMKEDVENMNTLEKLISEKNRIVLGLDLNKKE